MFRTFRKYQHIPGVLPAGKGHQGQILRHLHGHILQGMHRELHPSVPQSLIQFLYKQPLAANLIQCLIQDPIAGGLHGHQLQFCIRHSLGHGFHDHFALNHSQLALPAANSDFHSNSSNTLRISFAARAVLWWSFPEDTTPATSSSPVQTAGK